VSRRKALAEAWRARPASSCSESSNRPNGFLMQRFREDVCLIHARTMKPRRVGYPVGSVLMKRRAIGIVAASGAVLLGAADRGMEPQRLTGHFTVQWEEQSFQPCGSREKWWVSDPGPLLPRYRELVKGEYGSVFVTVQAEVTGRGQFGHLGMFPRAAAVREVIEARAAGDGDCNRRDVEVE
jgi:hypothetical protein